MRAATLCLLCAATLAAQTDAGRLTRILEPSLMPPEVLVYQVQHFLMPKVPFPAAAKTAREWTDQSTTLRRRFLDEVIFHGWPRAWVDAPPRFEEVGPAHQGPGYRVRKLRYEIVPGFYSAALLYLPEKFSGKAPAILNVNGHVGAPGKAVEYKQKRCIQQARMGIISLNLEWFHHGELAQPENNHYNAAHLDLAGANGVGLFYLAMRRGLDYLAAYPDADPKRLGVTGLSGGGWQTIVLSALDERVAVSVPVAGYSDLVARIERTGDIGDLEQNPTDMMRVGDYSHLTAMRAPRPTLIINNAEDDCCFRAELVKLGIYGRIRPFFDLYKAGSAFAWHENLDPADHNYQSDNRLQSHRFFARHFGLPVPEREPDADAEIRSFDELKVGMPADNLSVLGVARRLAAERGPRGDAARLREVVRYRPAMIRHAWAATNSKSKGLETRSLRFEFDDGLDAAGVWMKSLNAPESAPATILLHDEGKKSLGAPASERVNRGEQVLALDLLFTGDMAAQRPAPFQLSQMIAAAGDRPLGLRTAHLIVLARHLRESGKARRIRVEAHGMRSQLTALVAAALEPRAIDEVVVHNGIDSLQTLYDKPVSYQAAPEMFCLDLYKYFDIAALAELGRRR